jgi:1-deoxy-D-xylulose-5-phosphate reductoisomerase
MGAKVTIDSATLMNKGLEVIEAHWLFSLDYKKVDVVVHPQSIIHSIVTFCDGSSKAQLGVPDMKVPIQYALTYPDRWPANHDRVCWNSLGTLDFEEPDFDRFPCLKLAYAAGETGGAAPAILNAANEVAVEGFLQGRIGFVDIPRLVEAALEKAPEASANSLDSILKADEWTRRYLREELNTA